MFVRSEFCRGEKIGFNTLSFSTKAAASLFQYLFQCKILDEKFWKIAVSLNDLQSEVPAGKGTYSRFLFKLVYGFITAKKLNPFELDFSLQHAVTAANSCMRIEKRMRILEQITSCEQLRLVEKRL